MLVCSTLLSIDTLERLGAGHLFCEVIFRREIEGLCPRSLFDILYARNVLYGVFVLRIVPCRVRLRKEEEAVAEGSPRSLEQAPYHWFVRLYVQIPRLFVNFIFRISLARSRKQVFASVMRSARWTCLRGDAARVVQES